MKIVFLSVTCLGLAVEGMTPEEELAPSLATDWAYYNEYCSSSSLVVNEDCIDLSGKWTRALAPLKKEYVANLVFTGTECAFLKEVPPVDQIVSILQGRCLLETFCDLSCKMMSTREAGFSPPNSIAPDSTQETGPALSSQPLSMHDTLTVARQFRKKWECDINYMDKRKENSIAVAKYLIGPIENAKLVEFLSSCTCPVEEDKPKPGLPTFLKLLQSIEGCFVGDQKCKPICPWTKKL